MVRRDIQTWERLGTVVILVKSLTHHPQKRTVAMIEYKMFFWGLQRARVENALSREKTMILIFL